MKKNMSVWLGLVLLCGSTLLAENEGIHIYGPVPGLEASEFYSFRVRTVGSTNWLSPFAFITRCKGKDAEAAEPHYYTESLADWSQSYINFEMSNNVPVEVEITQLDGTNNPVPITKAVAHPVHKVESCTVSNGKAYVVFDNPALFTVDINGQMDDQDTARINPSGWSTNDFYSGPAIHTLTIFANPFLTDKPATNDANVYVVATNEIPPETGTWDTLYFEPGVHDIGRAFPVHADKSYYIPGDAVVHGTFYGTNWNDGHDIRIFGHGTLSGERIPHPDDDPFPTAPTNSESYRPIQIPGALNTTVEGITVTDSAFHSIMMSYGYEPDNPTVVRWVKIMTWRANGDGINPFANGLIEDCFIRTADDCTYVNGHGIRRCVFWTDVNGSAFTMTPIGGITNPDLVVEDCDIIYNRSRFTDGADGGRVFNMRGAGSGEGGTNVTFRNIRVSDPRPTRSCFAIQTASSYLDDPNYDQVRGDGDIVGVRFENISIAAPSIVGYPETLWGNTNAWIRDCVFSNVTMAGILFDSIDDFNHNDYVTNLVFSGTEPTTNLFLNTSGDGRWDTAANWDVGAVPTLLDSAKHTSVDTVLQVNSAAYASDLLVGHNTATSTVSVGSGGSLTVGGDAEIGNNGNAAGKLVVDGGNVSVGGTLYFSLFGTTRTGLGELNSGSITVGGQTVIGGNNTSTGILTINGGTFTATNNFFYVGVNVGDGTLNMNGGTLQLNTDTVWNPLRVGNGTGDGTINLNGGEIVTRGMIMDNAAGGISAINFNGGLLQVEGGFASAVSMNNSAEWTFDKGLFKWAGDRVADFTAFVDGGSITWTNGGTNMLTESWDAAWTNGAGVLYADYNDAEAGYTTVWAYDTNSIAPPPPPSPAGPSTNVFNNGSGDGLYTTTNNWDIGSVPTAEDLALHTSIGGVCLVDAPVDAGALEISHISTATVSVVTGGSLSVSNSVEVGNAGADGSVGILSVDGGSVSVGGTIEFGIFSTRTGIGALNSGSMTVDGETDIGGWNAGASGILTINDGIYTATNGNFLVGRSGPGTLNMNGGTLQLNTDTVWQPLRVGHTTGDGTLNLNGGTINTRMITMDANATGSAVINFNGGLLRIESGNANAVAMNDDAEWAFDAGVLKWNGNNLASITNLVGGGSITWTNGGTNMLTTAWEYSWTNGASVLYADYDDAEAGYTTVWACDTNNTVVPPSINILFLGNSFTFRHDLPLLVKTVFEEGHPETQVNVTRLTYGGKSMFHHYKMYHSETKLREATVTAAEIEAAIADIQVLDSLSNAPAFYTDYYATPGISPLDWSIPQSALPTAENNQSNLLASVNSGQRRTQWDYVVLQSWIDVVDDSQEGYGKYAELFADIAEQDGIKVILYVTAPYAQNATAVTEPIDPVETVMQMQSVHELVNRIQPYAVVPVALAIEQLHTDGYGTNLTFRYVNDAHPNQYGAFLTANMFYAAFFRESTVGFNFDTVTETLVTDGTDPDGGDPTVVFDEPTKLLLQQAAYDGVMAFGTPFTQWADSFLPALIGSETNDFDGDGFNNLLEYALNGNPTNATDTGRPALSTDGSVFTYVHAKLANDSTVVYRLLNTADLVHGSWTTNGYSSQVEGPVVGNYLTVTNDYDMTGRPVQVIKLEIEQQ